MDNKKKDLIKIVSPHKKISRDVHESDIEVVYKYAKKMYDLIGTKIGNYKGFYAIAHCQVTEEDPLRFFLCNPEMEIFNDMPEAVIINPKIIRHTRHTVKKTEGCLSYPKLPTKEVDRWHKCEVEFSVLTQAMKITKPITKNFSGILAQVFQHEIDHFNAKYIYDIK